MSVDSAGVQADGGSEWSSISADGRYVAFFSYATNLVPGDTNPPTDVFVRDRVTGATERVSVDSAGAPGNGNSGRSSISAGGRYVAFESGATNLVAGDTNGFGDIFVRDRVMAATERVSVNGDDGQGDGGSWYPSISADGRYVAFLSSASNLVSGDTNGFGDIFVRDRVTGATERVSVNSAGAEANNSSSGGAAPSISADGRYVAFDALASNLVPSDTNLVRDIFVRDRVAGATERVSVDSAGVQGNGYSHDPSLSTDGRYVAFGSSATNLVADDTNGVHDVFVRDRNTNVTERVSVDGAGAQGNNWSNDPSISADGRYVAFVSSASNLVTGDTSGFTDIFLRDRDTAVTERVSVDSAGNQGNSGSSYHSISADGRCVAFSSAASNLVPGDTNSWDVFVHSRLTGATERISVDSAGAQANGEAYYPYISADCRYVAFHSWASNLLPGDTNGATDVFRRDRMFGVLAVGGIAAPPDVAALPSAAAPADRNYAVYIIGVAAALVVVLGAARWRKRRA